MAGDDEEFDDAHLRGTIPFEDIDVLLEQDVEDIDPGALLLEVADGVVGVDGARDTPQPLPERTVVAEIPAELMQRALRPEQGWLEGYAIVGRNGVIRVSAAVYDQLRPGERIEVRVRRIPVPKRRT